MKLMKEVVGNDFCCFKQYKAMPIWNIAYFDMCQQTITFQAEDPGARQSAE
jgi:hypothetical protein